MQIYSFMLKHRSRNSNRVANAFSRRTTLLNTMTLEVIVLEELKRLYKIDLSWLRRVKSTRVDGVEIEHPTWITLSKKDSFLGTLNYVYREDQ